MPKYTYYPSFFYFDLFAQCSSILSYDNKLQSHVCTGINYSEQGLQNMSGDEVIPLHKMGGGGLLSIMEGGTQIWCNKFRTPNFPIF